VFVKKVSNYLSLVKFSHTVFAMPFALIGFTIATTRTDSHFEILLLAKVILCMVFARTAAMAFNRYIDRDIDSQNARTAIREIPKGIISPGSAITLVVLSSAAFIATTYSINPICFYLSPVALMVVLGYSLTKRFTWLCHLILGIGLSLAPIGAYLAVTGKFDLLPLFFSFTVITWVSGFDIIYALQDEEFDRKLNLNSMPVAFGKRGALNISILLHFFSVFFVFVAGLFLPFGTIYWIGFAIFTILITYQHLIVKPNDLSRVNLAFFTTNGIASIVFAAFVIADLVFAK